MRREKGKTKGAAPALPSFLPFCFLNSADPTISEPGTGYVKIKHEQLDKAIWADIRRAFLKSAFSLLLVATKFDCLNSDIISDYQTALKIC